jgi:CDP-diacylglycerol---serine O-phosphatidyltransferase
MFLSFEWGDWLFRSPYLNAVAVTGIAVLMISKVPTVSLKRIRVRHDWVVPTLLGIGVLAALVTTFPWPTLTAIGIVYVGSIPLTIRAYYRLRRNTELRRSEPADAIDPALPPGLYSLDDEPPPATQWKH